MCVTAFASSLKACSNLGERGCGRKVLEEEVAEMDEVVLDGYFTKSKNS